MFTKTPKKVRYKGKFWTIRQLAASTGVSRTILSNRIMTLGWTPERAVREATPNPRENPGTSRAASRGKFKSRIYVDGKQRFLGSFDSAAEASAIYRACRVLRDKGTLLEFLDGGGDPRSLIGAKAPPASQGKHPANPHPRARSKAAEAEETARAVSIAEAFAQALGKALSPSLDRTLATWATQTVLPTVLALALSGGLPAPLPLSGKGASGGPAEGGRQRRAAATRRRAEAHPPLPLPLPNGSCA